MNLQPQRQPGQQIPSDELARLAAAAIVERKAIRPVLLDIREHGSYASFLLIASAQSDRHVQAIAEGAIDGLAQAGQRPIGVEGSGHWVLVDYGDVVIHVFFQGARELYDLEGMWHDARRVKLDIPREVAAELGL